MSHLRVKNDTQPATPPSGRTEIYVDTVTKKLNTIDDTGLVTDYSLTVEPYFSAGIYDIPTITENSGTITIGNDGTYNLFNYTDGSGVVHNYSINGGSFTPTTGGLSYIVANYNSGTPVIQMITDVSLINETTIIPVVTIYCDGVQCHILDWDQLGKALSNKLHQSIVKTQRYRRESGLTLGEQATRYVTISSGIVWVGANRQTPAAINSSVDNLTFFYHVGGVWTTTPINQYNNTQYDNGTNLVTLTNDRYAVNYVYRSVDNHKDVYILLGSGDYTLNQAQASQPPSLPSVVANTSILVGRIIIQKNASISAQIDSAFVTTFTSSGVQNHNDLANIQGGTTGEYYHLSATEKANLSGVNTGDSNINVTNTTTNATYYPVFVSNTSGTLPANVNTTFKFNPGTNTLSVGSNLGVGTSSPTALVHVNGPASTSTYIKITNATTSGTTSTDGLNIGIDSSANAEIRCYENTNLNIFTNNTQRMTILSGGNVGIATTSPVSTFENNGSQGAKFTTVTDTTTLDATHNIVYCNKATAMTINLPAASGCSGRIYTVKNINDGIVTIDGNASETIDGELTKDLVTKYKSITIQSNGSAWFII